jgi:hypothetical protein
MNTNADLAEVTNVVVSHVEVESERDGVAHYDSDIVGECTDEEAEMIEAWFKYTDLDALGEAIVASDKVQDTMESDFDSAWSDAADDDYIRRNGLDAFYGVSGQF